MQDNSRFQDHFYWDVCSDTLLSSGSRVLVAQPSCGVDVVSSTEQIASGGQSDTDFGTLDLPAGRANDEFANGTAKQLSRFGTRG